MMALLAGALLASLALAFVLYPLFDERAAVTAPRGRRAIGPLTATPDAVDALREIEFDRATGKLSDADYAALRETYTRRALAEMRATGATAPQPDESAADDPVEAMIRLQRAHLLSCPTHGPRPESDAVFCSDCGRYLGQACPGCGGAIQEPDARFCSACGSAFAT